MRIQEILDRMFDIHVKRMSEGYDGELRELLDEYKGLTGNDEPPFMHMSIITEAVCRGKDIDKIASTIREDAFGGASDLAEQVIDSTSYILMEHEIKNAVLYGDNMNKIMTIPVAPGGRQALLHLALEYKSNTFKMIAIGKMPESLLKETADILCKMLF